MKQLNEFDTLAEAQAYEFVTQRMIAPDMMISMLTMHNSVLSLQEQGSTDDKAAGFLMALYGSVSDYNLITGHSVGDAQQQSLAYLVANNAVTQSFADAAINYANNYITKPYKNTTQAQFNVANNICTEKEVKNYSYGQSIKITLSADLPEKCTATTWDHDGDFAPENVGRSVPVHTADKPYKIKMSGVTVSGNLFVRIPFETDFSVEAV